MFSINELSLNQHLPLSAAVVTSVISAETTQRNNQLNENLTILLEINLNLKNINHKLNTTVKNLTVQFDKLNKSCAALKRNNLTEKMQDVENEFNVSRAQWSIDQYCPLKRDGTYRTNSLFPKK